MEWQLVPKEPTEAMIQAADDGDMEYTRRNFGDIQKVMQGPYDHWCAMLAAAPEPPQQMTWRPIETAPRDATAVLVMRNIWPGTDSGRAEECNAHNTYVAGWWQGERNGAGAWVCYMDAVCDPHCPIEPTHWMPLPAPPTEPT